MRREDKEERTEGRKEAEETKTTNRLGHPRRRRKAQRLWEGTNISHLPTGPFHPDLSATNGLKTGAADYLALSAPESVQKCR